MALSPAPNTDTSTSTSNTTTPTPTPTPNTATTTSSPAHTPTPPPCSSLFSTVKFYLSGDVPPQVLDLLRSGGAEHTKYFSDFVSHLICGNNVSENDLTDANDLYEIPAITYHWVLACIKQNKLVSTKPYNPAKNQLFTGVTACISRVSANDAKTLYALITYYGGIVRLNLDSSCTHLISGVASGNKYNVAVTIPQEKLKIVTPDWVTDSIKAKIQCAHDVYHPKLLRSPSATPSTENPTGKMGSITGFDFEEGIAKTEVPTQNLSETKDDKQALLDKLKQRMPWNHAISSSPTSQGIPSSPTIMISTAGAQLKQNSMSGMTPNQIVQKVISNIPSSTPSTQAFVQQQLQQQQQMQQQQIQQQQQQIQQQQQMQQQQQIQQQQIQQQQQQQQFQQQQQQPQQQQQQPILQQQISQNQQVHMSQAQMVQNQTNQSQMVQNQTGQAQMIQNQANQGQLIQNQTSQGQLMQNSSNQGPMVQNTTSQGQIIQGQMIQGQNIPNTPTSVSTVQQGLSAIQIQQQRMLQQHQLRMQMQMQNQQNMVGKNVTVSQGQQILTNHIIPNTSQGQVMNQNIVMQQNQVVNQNHTGLHQQQVGGPGINQQAQLVMNQNKPMGNLQQQTMPGQVQVPQQQQQQQQQQPNLIQQIQQPTGQQININQQSNQMTMNVQQQQNIQQQGIMQSPTQQNQGQGITMTQQQQNQLHTLNQQILNSQQQGNVMQQNWRQQPQNILVQSSQQNLIPNQQVIRNTMLQQRGQMQPNQMILQQQIVQNQNINQQTNMVPGQQIVQQGNVQQMQPGQVLVQKQLQPGVGVQQQIMQGQTQMVNNAGQQIMMQTGQHMLQQNVQQPGNTQIISQGQQQPQQQIIAQGQQIITQGGSQILTQGGQQILTQGGQQIVAQGNQQIINQGGQQIIAQGNQIAQTGTPGQPQQVITQQGGQQIMWQQQQFVPQRQHQIITAQPGQVGPRVQWGAGTGGRQLIHLDAQTHAQLQQMDPKQRALFVAQLQKRRQLSVQRAQAVTFVRGHAPRPQVQWLQQPGGTRMVAPNGEVPPSPQQVVAGPPQVVAAQQPPPAQQQQSPQLQPQSPQLQQQQQQQRQQYQQLQMQRQQQYQQLQMLQAQREHVQKKAQAQVGQVPGSPAAAVVGRPLPEAVPPSPDAVVAQGAPPDQVGTVVVGGAAPPGVVVNSRTKTALANMLSIRLQGTQPTNLPPEVAEPSAAGTLRLMTAAHNAPPRAPAEMVQSLQQRRPGPTMHHQMPVSPHQAMPYGCQTVARPAVPAPPPPVAPPRAQFYGHNPNLKLPPDLFLLGCIFHVVEYNNSKKWAEIVGRHGGEVELGYCARVTHVLSQTQKHGVVMQALRDAKRCVTAYWLSDTMKKKQVAPPWQALHLPLMYASHEKPAQRHRAALTGFMEEERDRVRFMLQHTGAKYTSYLSRDNTVIICRKPEGTKYMKAREWGIPTVSVLWLTDLLLGNMSALTQIEHTKYQQYNVGNPFRMDYTLVPHLMNAWKMPINITQESHERVKRGALPTSVAPKAKKPKLDDNSHQLLPLTNITPDPNIDPATAPRVIFSSIKDVTQYESLIKMLGGFIVTDVSEATHLIMGRLVRTPKLVMALIRVKYILTIEWLKECQKQSKFIEEKAYSIKDEEFEKTYKCDVSKVLSMGDERTRLFNGITFYMTPSVQPGRSVLTKMIEMCGGRVEKNRKSLVAIQEMHSNNPLSYLVLTVPNDLHLVFYILQMDKKLKIICSTELILSSIMQQRVEVDEYLVTIKPGDASIL